MKFSVITPVFNGMPKLRQCIGSIRGQKGMDVEHIVQDGESSDGTAEFLDEFYKKCPVSEKYRFSYTSEPDSGMYDAINKGWSRASGDILSWLNHDEQYLPGTLGKVASVFAQQPEVDFVYGNFIILTPDGLPISARREIPLRMSYLRHSNLYAASCTMFFRSRLLQKGDLVFSKDYDLAGDMDLVMRLLHQGYESYHMNSYLGLFGADDGNLTVTQNDVMWRETIDIWSKFGGSRNSFIRKIIKGTRWSERFFSGCYRKDDLSFKYALDEVPTYKTVNADKVTFRFGFDKISKLKDLRCKT